MSAITYDTIKVVGVPYSKLLSLEIIHFPNQHGTAKMTGHLVQYADWFEGLQWYGLLYHGYWRFRFCNLQHKQNWHLFHLCGESLFCQR